MQGGRIGDWGRRFGTGRWRNREEEGAAVMVTEKPKAELLLFWGNFYREM